MHTSGSQTGISAARLRFSQRAVLVGNVPSHGSALTGKRSPRPAIISPSTARTNSGASRETGARIFPLPLERGEGQGEGFTSTLLVPKLLVAVSPPPPPPPPTTGGGG